MSKRLELIRCDHRLQRQKKVDDIYAFECKCEIVTVAIRGYWMACGWQYYTKLSLSIALLPSLSDIVLRVTVPFFLSFFCFCFHFSVGAL